MSKQQPVEFIIQHHVAGKTFKVNVYRSTNLIASERLAFSIKELVNMRSTSYDDIFEAIADNLEFETGIDVHNAIKHRDYWYEQTLTTTLN